MKSATRLLPLFLFLFVFSSTSQALFAQGSGTTLIIAEEGDLVTTDEIELGLMCEPNLTDSGRIFFRNLQFPSEHKRVVPNTRSVSNRRSSPTAFLKHECSKPQNHLFLRLRVGLVLLKYLAARR